MRRRAGGSYSVNHGSDGRRVTRVPGGSPFGFKSVANGPAANAASITIGKPAGTVANDLLVAILGSISSSSSTDPIGAVPSGWTTAGEQTFQTATGHLAIYTKVAGVSEPSSYAWGNASSFYVGAILNYGGGHGSDAAPTYTFSAGISATWVAPAITAATSGDLRLAVEVNTAGPGTVTVGAPSTGGPWTARNNGTSAWVGVYEAGPISGTGAQGQVSGSLSPSATSLGCSILVKS